jgi:hypothetical protein
MLIKCWCCEEEKTADELCEVCSERASDLIRDGLSVCLGCCICHFYETLTIKNTGERHASS